MFNLTGKTINIINNSFVWCYRLLVLLMLLILILQSDSILNTIPLFNYLPQFLLNLHKAPEVLSIIFEQNKTVTEMLSLLTNLVNQHGAEIVELSNQNKAISHELLLLKDELLFIKGEYKQLIENINTSIQAIQINPEIDIHFLENLLNTKLEDQASCISTILNKINDFTSLQQIQLEQIKVSHKLLKGAFTLQNNNLIEIKNSIISGNQLLIETFSTKTKELLLNLNASNNSMSANNNLLNQLLINQKENLSTSDFLKGMETFQKDFMTLNSNINNNGHNIKDISSTLTGLDFNFHNKVNNLETKVDTIQGIVENINSTKVVKTEVQGNSQSIWNWNKK